MARRDHPEQAYGPGHSLSIFNVRPRYLPAQRRPDIAVLLVQRLQPRQLTRTLDLRLGQFGELDKEVRVPALSSFHFSTATPAELLTSVFAQCLQHAVSDTAVSRHLSQD